VFSGDRTREDVAEAAAKAETAAGHRPCLIPVGASNDVGAVGFVAAMEELNAQLKERDLRVDRVVFASSSFGTQAGLCVGAKALGFSGQLAAIAIDSSREELQTGVTAIAAPTIDRLGLALSVAPDEVVAYDGYLGAGYAVMGEPEREAIALVARTEGILLDPVYTGGRWRGDRPHPQGRVRQGRDDRLLAHGRRGGAVRVCRAVPGRLLKRPICGVGALRRSLRRTSSTSRSGYSAPSCIWAFLSSLHKSYPSTSRGRGEAISKRCTDAE